MIPSLLFWACADADPHLTVHATVEGETIIVEWADVLIRRADQPWDSDWTPLTVSGETTISADAFSKIATGIPAQTEYLHLFADADHVVGHQGTIGDIIEPIATPFTFDGRWRIDLTLIILNVNGEDQIFAKDANAYKD